MITMKFRQKNIPVILRCGGGVGHWPNRALTNPKGRYMGDEPTRSEAEVWDGLTDEQQWEVLESLPNFGDEDEWAPTATHREDW